MGKFKDLTGQRFGCLTVLGRADVKHGCIQWFCYCDCNNKTICYGFGLTTGQTQSCGCLGKERRCAANLKHGDATHSGRASEYNSWAGMWKRCTNPKDKKYHLYGGRGITVCERWRSYENFLTDVGRKSNPQLSLDRYPDPNGNYEPANIRWATASEQNFNRRKLDRCKRGHTFSRVARNGRRYCRTCLNLLSRARYARKGAPK